jgi:DNA-directed RNA polymerase subunit RPC12/RpoP
MTARCTICGRRWNISIQQNPHGYICPDCATRREMEQSGILKGAKSHDYIPYSPELFPALPNQS